MDNSSRKEESYDKKKLDELMTLMVKTKVTILIRVPKEATAEYSAAEAHIATIQELSKQDANWYSIIKESTM
jgi:hypothetical protein